MIIIIVKVGFLVHMQCMGSESHNYNYTSLSMYIGRVGEKKPTGLYTVAMIVTTKEEHIELNDAVAVCTCCAACMHTTALWEITTVRIISHHSSTTVRISSVE